MAKLTTEEFIKKAKAVHGDKYDYSKVEYVTNRTKVCIVCPEHGEFLQRPSDHINGHECPQCGKEKNKKSRSKNIAQFVEEARKVHGDKYDYSKVKYVKGTTKVTIICPEHGEFLQRPKDHIIGQGCPWCRNRVKLSTEDFINKAREVHGEKYDYSKVNYVNNRTKVTIICPKHGAFLQDPSHHLSGKGCKRCSIESKADAHRKTKEEFIEEARIVHGDKYDYSKVQYVNGSTKVTIICPEHGEFQQRPTQHKRGQGCPLCSGNVKLTTEEFIKSAREVHGDKYDYSKVKYVNGTTKVTIICPEHGEFLQSPGTHIQGQGCPKCGMEIAKSSRRKTQEKFIEEAKEVWGDKYDYSLVKYVNTMTKVDIICKEHGVFSPIPNNFLRGHGCPECGIIMNSINLASNTEEFIAKSREIHGDKYDYSKVVYKNNKTKVTIICPEHGEFQQMPNSHLEGKGCTKCAQNEMSNNEEFIEKARKIHGDKYDYSLVEYNGNKKKVKIICPKHGEFKQLPNHHLKGVGCPMCAGLKKHTTEEFIVLARKIHGDKYDYSLVDYQGNKKRVKIVCPIHGVFEQKPNQHLSGQGCPHCTESKGEKTVRLYLEKNNINFIAYHSFDDCRNINPLPFDFFLPQNNTCIEFQGIQHYEEIETFGGKKGFEYRQRMDNIKREYCKKNGIRLIEIRYDEDVEEVLKKLLLRQDDSLD